MASEFRGLVAYRLSVAFADEMYELIARWPPFDRWSSGVRLIEARGLLERGASERLSEIARALNGLIKKWGST
jgi:hypothetical protein